jgi:anaerobic selenocysteine-containing dehydrogenase
MIARRIDGRVVKFEGHPGNPRNLGTLCPKGQAQISSIYDPNRVKTPLIRTNAKGATGEWRSATWDEALTLVANRVNEVRARNPKLVLWQKGRSKSKAFYDDAFPAALGCSKLGHGAYCSDTGYRAMEYTIGLHGVQNPDFDHVNYLLSWGWNITNAGGNRLCWITYNQQLLKARERGLKVIQIDPRLRGAGPFTDKWLPIRPGTDLALALALCQQLIAKGYLDVPYLSTFTDGPYLLGEDGRFLRDADGSPQVFDRATGGAVPAGTAADPALDGTFRIDGVLRYTAFERFIRHVRQYTPQWAAGVTGLRAEDIALIAEEFGENARIGSTTVIDGVELPYRPVGIMSYHMAQQELGFQAIRAMTLVAMLVGAVGAAGGLLSDFTWKIDKNYAAFGNLEVTDPPYDFTLAKSKYYPINTGHPGIVAKVMADPASYGVDEIPEVAILHHVNPLGAFPDQKAMMEGYERFTFVAVIGPWISETADFYADVVLPAATIEKYEGPLDASDGVFEATALRVPPMEPLFESRGEIDIYLDLVERIGVLFGEEGYLDQVNMSLGMKDTEFALPLDVKPTVREIFDRWANFKKIPGGVAFFEENGVFVKGKMAASKLYGYAADPPFGGAVHRIYGESLLLAQEAMKSKGAGRIYWQDYTPFPTWRDPTYEGSPPEYDLYLISYKLVEHKQSRTTSNPLLAELAPRSRLDINPATAAARGIDEGDRVWVESHNALTGETRRVKTWAALTEGIRPDTVGMPHHFGGWTHPLNSGTSQGPTPNTLYFTGEGYSGQTADATYMVKVRVSRAGGEG